MWVYITLFKSKNQRHNFQCIHFQQELLTSPYTHTPTHPLTIYTNIRILCSFIVVLASFKMHSLTLMQRCESQAFSNSKPTLINLWISKRVGVCVCCASQIFPTLPLSLSLALSFVLLVIFVFSAWLLLPSISMPSKENITQRDLNNFHPLFVCIWIEYVYVCIFFNFFSLHFQHEIFFPCYFSTPYRLVLDFKPKMCAPG